MAVNPVCEKCGTRRDAAKPGGAECQDKVGHKRFVGWVADWKPSRKEPRMQKTYASTLDRPKDLAESQFRKWKTDREQGTLKWKKETESDVATFGSIADKWWTQVVVVEGRIKNAKGSEKSRFEAWKKRFGDKLLGDEIPERQEKHYLTMEDIEDWLTERRESGIAINTINRDMKPLRWILDYAVRKELIKENIAAGFKPLKGGNIHDRWLNDAEIDKLIWAAKKLDDHELATFDAVGLNTGFRMGNLERLEARAIEFNEGLVHAIKTKSGDPYSVPISPTLEPILRQLVRQKQTGPLLIGRDNNVGLRFREAAKLAGLYKDAKDPERVTPHTMRHTFAVQYLRRRDPKTGKYGDIWRLSKLLGHASVAITDKIYARFCIEDKIAQASLIDTPVPHMQTELKVV
jgi:integrase